MRPQNEKKLNPIRGDRIVASSLEKSYRDENPNVESNTNKELDYEIR